MYEKTEWKARQGADLNRFEKSQETSKSVILQNAPSSVTEPGTPFSPANMNKIEQGIFDAHEAVARETQTRIEADNTLAESAAAEANARQEGDASLAESIAAETQARQHGDETLAQAISDEAAARAEADTALAENYEHFLETVTEMLSDVSAIEALFAKKILDMHPVGTIYESVKNINPAEFIGGTWTVWGSGRVSVGVDTTQTEFNTVEKTNSANTKTHTLSENEMPSHNHDQDYHYHGLSTGGTAGSSSTDHVTRGWGNTSVKNLSSVQPWIYHKGGGAAHNNLQPYITSYKFKRTA